MLCHACHVHLRRDYPYCLKCGTLRKGAKLTRFAAPELHVGDRTYALVRPVMTIGRTTDYDIVLDDARVSIFIGDVGVCFAQPRSAAVGGETMAMFPIWHRLYKKVVSAVRWLVAKPAPVQVST